MVDSRMKHIEAKIKHALENKGIKCQSIFAMKDPDDTRVLLAFNSQDNRKLSVRKIENALASMNVGEFQALLLKIDQEQVEELEEGREEVEELTS